MKEINEILTKESINENKRMMGMKSDYDRFTDLFVDHILKYIDQLEIEESKLKLHRI